MAQAGSVQREPSMEEILASIRRIIEDSDSDQAPNRTSGGMPTAELSANDAGDVEHFRAELHPEREEEVLRGPDLRLAETPGDDISDPSHDLEEGAGSDESAEIGGDASSVLDWPVNDWQGDARAEEEPGEAQAGGLTTLAGFAADASMQAPDESSERKSAMISEHAERKIAAAFEELNEAFEASRRQSLDEVAEEMLRPMLQEWLDNNLPLLVEKLVREEIERVARGGAR